MNVVNGCHYGLVCYFVCCQFFSWDNVQFKNLFQPNSISKKTTLDWFRDPFERFVPRSLNIEDGESLQLEPTKNVTKPPVAEK